MARFVKLTVVYDMDDESKPLAAEFADWVAGNVGLGDFAAEEWSMVELHEGIAQAWLLANASLTKT